MAGYTIPDPRDEIIHDLVRGLGTLRIFTNVKLAISGSSDQERAELLRPVDEVIARARQHLGAKP